MPGPSIRAVTAREIDRAINMLERYATHIDYAERLTSRPGYPQLTEAFGAIKTLTVELDALTRALRTQF